MMRSPKGNRHPFRYAHILSIYHANVLFFDDTRPKRCKFLFVRWFKIDQAWISGPSAHCLERLHYLPASDPAAFGFLDPRHVIRACHLLPAFALESTSEFLGTSSARDTIIGDYKRHYVSRYAMLLHG